MAVRRPIRGAIHTTSKPLYSGKPRVIWYLSRGSSVLRIEFSDSTANQTEQAWARSITHVGGVLEAGVAKHGERTRQPFGCAPSMPSRAPHKLMISASPAIVNGRPSARQVMHHPLGLHIQNLLLLLLLLN